VNSGRATSGRARALPIIAWKPGAAAAGIWVQEYYFGLPAAEMKPGKYRAVVTDTMTRTWANPMWGVEPGTGRQSNDGCDWTENEPRMFTVVVAGP